MVINNNNNKKNVENSKIKNENKDSEKIKYVLQKVEMWHPNYQRVVLEFMYVKLWGTFSL